MATVKLDMSGTLKLFKNAQRLSENGTRQAVEKSVKQLSAVYIRTAKKNTPVLGNVRRKDERTGKVYQSKSGHMRRHWNVTDLERHGHRYEQTVYNDAATQNSNGVTEYYAGYVNDGHRQKPGRYVPILGKRLVKDWVDGLHMREKAQKSVKRVSNRVITQNLQKVERGLFD